MVFHSHFLVFGCKPVWSASPSNSWTLVSVWFRTADSAGIIVHVTKFSNIVMYCMLLAVRQLVKKTEPLNVGEIAALEEKLERCRTQENNPLSDLYVLTVI